MRFLRFVDMRRDLREAEARLVDAAKRVALAEIRVEIAERAVARRRMKRGGL